MIAILACLAVLVSIIWFGLSSPDLQTSSPSQTQAVSTIDKVLLSTLPQSSSISTYSNVEPYASSASVNSYATAVVQEKEPASHSATASQPKTSAITPPPPSKPAIKTTPTTIFIGKGQLYIQVGAYQKELLADSMYKKMKQHYKRAKVVAKGKMHAVWVGPVTSRKEALALKKRILRLDKLAGFIVSEKP